MQQEFGHCGGLHGAHRLEFAGPLAVEKLAVLTQDRKRGNALVQGDMVAVRNIQVFVEPPDIDMHQDEVSVQQRSIRGIVEIMIENVAISAPVAAKVENHAVVGRPRRDKSRVQFELCAVGGGINVLLGGSAADARQRDQQGQKRGRECPQVEGHAKP